MRKVKLVVIANDLVPAGGYLEISGEKVAPIFPPRPQFTIVVQDEAPIDDGKEAVGLAAFAVDLPATSPARAKGLRYDLVDEALEKLRDYLYEAIEK